MEQRVSMSDERRSALSFIAENGREKFGGHVPNPTLAEVAGLIDERDILSHRLARAEQERDEARALLVEAREALQKVGPVVQSLLDEAGGRKATDWGLVNNGLLEVAGVARKLGAALDPAAVAKGEK